MSKKFDADQQKRTLEWLNKKWPLEKRECDICGAKDWSLSTDLTTPLVVDQGIQIGGTIYPNVSVICQNCGNTKYFNAVKIGLVDEAKKGKDG